MKSKDKAKTRLILMKIADRTEKLEDRKRVYRRRTQKRIYQRLTEA